MSASNNSLSTEQHALAHITVVLEELPLFTELGFLTGLMNVSVEISFDREEQWSISSISLYGYGPQNEGKYIELDRADRPELYAMLYDAIENHGKEAVENAIQREHDWLMDAAE